MSDEKKIDELKNKINADELFQTIGVLTVLKNRLESENFNLKKEKEELQKLLKDQVEPKQ